MAKKEVVGICHICGEEKKLSYEHIPPQSAGNSQRAITMNAVEVMIAAVEKEQFPWETGDVAEEVKQRGTGAYTLCTKCNSETGTRYVSEFFKVWKQSLDASNYIGYDPSNEVVVADYKMKPLRFIKSIIGMFASVTKYGSLDESIYKMILDEDAKGISSTDYGLYMYYYSGGLSRQSGFSCMGRIDGSVIISAEFTSLPFGFVLIKNPPRDSKLGLDYGLDITEMFNNYEINDERTVTLELPVFSQASPMPLDFRTQDKIKSDFKKNKLTSQVKEASDKGV